MPNGQPSRTAPQKFVVVDLFCGAGGSTSGIAEACAELGLDYDLICVNHWPTAIESHRANHPRATHLCTSVDNIDPRTVIPSGRVHLLWASPECIYFSVARGGRPMNDQSRASAWHVLRWAEALYIDAIAIENVKEFQSWGPLGVSGRPIKSKEGETFRAFIAALRSLGYTVSWKVLCAADYGDPTTRERLFILARRGARKIVWLEATHSRDGGRDLFGAKPKWRAAREIIDWSIEGTSLFARKKPLAQSTLRRIEAGLRKFAGPPADPFLVVLRQHQDAQSLDRPVPTLCASGQHLGLAEPFLVPLRKGQAPRSAERPLPTLTTTEQMALCEPFVLPQQSGGLARSVQDPVPTVATKGAIALVEPVVKTAAEGTALPPFLVHTQHPHHPPKSVGEPIGTVTAQSSNIGLCQAFLLADPDDHKRHQGGTRRVESAEEPGLTVAGPNCIALGEPFLLPLNHPGRPPHSINEPVRTITAGSSDFALVEPVAVTQAGQHASEAAAPTPEACPSSVLDRSPPAPSTMLPVHPEPPSVAAYLVKYYNTGPGVQPLSQPLDTVTTKDRFALVQPSLTAIAQHAPGPSAVRAIDPSALTSTATARPAICRPFLIPFFGERPNPEPRAHSIEEPLPTVTSHGAGALVTPYLLPVNHGKHDRRTHSVDHPMPTITSVDALGLVEPVLRPSPAGGSPDQPVLYHLDIRFRMLQPHELAAAMSFPRGYIFKGSREAQVKQIGNAVPKETAKALAKALVAPRHLASSPPPSSGSQPQLTPATPVPPPSPHPAPDLTMVTLRQRRDIHAPDTTRPFPLGP